jgi:succinate dehydrogenase/fumarate reductase cytochrome b subunit
MSEYYFRGIVMWARAHRITGVLILIFVTMHLGVHLTALVGISAHNETLLFVQILYRNPVAEPLLLSALLLQIGIGVRFALLRWRSTKDDRWARLQLVSGLYLAFFIINHTGAALFARYGAGLETNFYWASGVLLHPILRWYFYPYYALAIIAVFAHAATAVWYRTRSARSVRLVMISGVGAAVLILLSFGGWLYPIPTPSAYQRYYNGLIAL